MGSTWAHARCHYADTQALSLNRHACTMRARLRLFSASRFDERHDEWLVRLVATMRHWFSPGLHLAFLIIDPEWLSCWIDFWIFLLLRWETLDVFYWYYHDWIPLPDWSHFFSRSASGARWTFHQAKAQPDMTYQVAHLSEIKAALRRFTRNEVTKNATAKSNCNLQSHPRFAAQAGSQQKRNVTSLCIFPKSLRDRAMMLWMSRAE